MPISKELKKMREKMLMTQDVFAKELGVATSTVNRWETEKARPNMSAMKVIRSFCEFYNYPYEEIERAWLEHL